MGVMPRPLRKRKCVGSEFFQYPGISSQGFDDPPEYPAAYGGIIDELELDTPINSTYCKNAREFRRN
jgi:hypothetical protein